MGSETHRAYVAREVYTSFTSQLQLPNDNPKDWIEPGFFFFFYTSRLHTCVETPRSCSPAQPKSRRIGSTQLIGFLRGCVRWDVNGPENIVLFCLLSRIYTQSTVTMVTLSWGLAWPTEWRGIAIDCLRSNSALYVCSAVLQALKCVCKKKHNTCARLCYMHDYRGCGYVTCMIIVVAVMLHAWL